MKRKYLSPRISAIATISDKEIAQHLTIVSYDGDPSEEVDVREEVGFLENDGVMGKPYNVWDEEW